MKLKCIGPNFQGEYVSAIQLANQLKFQYLDELTFESYSLKRQLIAQGNQFLQVGAIPLAVLERGKTLSVFFRKKVFADVSIRFIDASIGYGLFAERRLSKGAFIGEYIGRVQSHRYNTAYLMKYPLKDYFGYHYVVDATNGNLARFINHSDDPNVKCYHCFKDGVFRLAILATRSIERGEQLLLDYGPTYWQSAQITPKKL